MPALADMLVDLLHHLLARERFAHPRVRARAREHLLQRILRQIGDEDDGNVFLVRLRLEHFAQAIAFDARQIDVEKDDVGRVAGEDMVELDPARSSQNRTAFALEKRAAELENEWVVVEDQDSNLRQRRRHRRAFPFTLDDVNLRHDTFDFEETLHGMIRLPADYYAAPSREVEPMFPPWVQFGCGIAAAVFLVLGFGTAAVVMHTGLGKLMAVVLDLSAAKLPSMMGKDVTPAQRQALNQELSQLSKNVETDKTSVARLQPVLQTMQDSMADQKITPQEAAKITKAAHDANGPPAPNGAAASAGGGLQGKDRVRGPAKAGAPSAPK